MLGSVTCRACGARIREDRARCLRCGASLARPAETARRLSPRVVGIAAGVAVVAVGAALIASRPTMPVTAASSVSSTSAAPKSEAVAAVAESPSDTAAQAAPAFAALDLSRAGLSAYSRGDVAGSVEQFSAAVDADPANAQVLNNLGQALVRAGRAREAVPYFDRAVAAAEDVWAYHFNRARAYAELQEWGQAVAGYRKAAALFPDDYVTAFNLAKALQANGDLPGAITEFQRAIMLAPSEADFRLSLAYALETAKRQGEAVAAYRGYLELQDSGATAEKVKARIKALESKS